MHRPQKTSKKKDMIQRVFKKCGVLLLEIKMQKSISVNLNIDTDHESEEDTFELDSSNE